ncbi:uncharacterized protein BCR38DRAFT_408944 [Pseudomassariella vexata]|uniref:Uncharacterized protein n=1 Tax=Pseudomassariella vexata TaxID=1141098 RepID=A0A1Y2E1L8_9PEZI|nr:uncharacterized protein BCR38DRAFT_408944 [Pseudomassariella vexata]ORY65216.1 hypothetical protein BCR38DRAFT_408944 [Pseudomassariella vexata]
MHRDSAMDDDDAILLCATQPSSLISKKHQGPGINQGPKVPLACEALKDFTMPSQIATSYLQELVEQLIISGDHMQAVSDDATGGAMHMSFGREIFGWSRCGTVNGKDLEVSIHSPWYQRISYRQVLALVLAGQGWRLGLHNRKYEGHHGQG